MHIELGKQSAKAFGFGEGLSGRFGHASMHGGRSPGLGAFISVRFSLLTRIKSGVDHRDRLERCAKAGPLVCGGTLAFGRQPGSLLCHPDAGGLLSQPAMPSCHPSCRRRRLRLDVASVVVRHGRRARTQALRGRT